MLERIKSTASFIRSKVDFDPQVGIILGTGLGGLVNHIDIAATLDYRDIPDFPVSTVEGHAGRFIFGSLGGKRVVAMQGRFHYYEGYTPQQVVFPVRVMKFLGIRCLFVSNASGGVNPMFRTGDLMVITDHINLIPNPLIGPNIDELGTRFPDMSEPYSRKLIALSDEVARILQRDFPEVDYGKQLARARNWCVLRGQAIRNVLLFLRKWFANAAKPPKNDRPQTSAPKPTLPTQRPCVSDTAFKVPTEAELEENRLRGLAVMAQYWGKQQAALA